MVVLVGGDHKERVLLGNAVLFQPGEELAERVVVCRQLVDVALFPGTEGRFDGGTDAGDRLPLIVMRVGDIQIDDRHTRLEHRGRVSERLRGRRIKPRKARIAMAVGDDIAIEVFDRTAGRNLRLDIGIAVERVEPDIASRLVRQLVRRRVLAAERAVLCAMDDDAFKVRDSLGGVGFGLGGLRRVGTKDIVDVARHILKFHIGD